jgi:hypothetical protein
MRKKTEIGWVEYIDFPEWGIKGIKAKVDTGARTSAMHVANLKEVEPGQVQFDVVYTHRPPYNTQTVTAKVLKWAKVRSSTGEYRRRCFVETSIELAGVTKKIEITLVCRKKMLFRMLLGRKALEKDFLVDVSKRKAVSQMTPRKLQTIS